MQGFFIVLLCLWFFPFIPYVFLWIFRRHQNALLKIRYGTIAITLFVLAAWSYGWSTTSFEVNCFLLMQLYFTVSYLLALGTNLKNRLLKYGSLVVMVLVFGIGYLVSSIGILGLGMIMVQEEPVRLVKLDDHLTCKVYSLGNALSDYDGVRISVSRSYAWLPYMEKEVVERKYIDKFEYKISKITFKYNLDKGQLIMADSSYSAVIKLH